MKIDNRLTRWCENPKRLKKLFYATLILGIAMTAIGFPVQVYINYQNQHCGLNPLLILLPLLIYVVRTPYNIGKRAWAYVPPDMIGLAACLVLLWQYFYYNW